jgi:hypothetical protein
MPLLFGNTASAGVQAGFATSGLVLHFDAGNASSYSGSGSTWNDISSSSRPLTLYNSPTFVSSGTSSYFRFNGSSQYAESTNVGGLISGLANATASIWYRPLSTDDNGMLYDFNNYSSAGTRDNFAIRQNWGGGNTAGYTVDSDGNFASVNFENSNSYLNTWRNYTQVRRDGTMYAFVNGAQVGSANISGTIRTTNALRLGQDSINTNYLNADFAVFHVYNRGLSDAEVLANFNVLKARYGY